MVFSSIQLSLLSWLNGAETIAKDKAYYVTQEVEPLPTWGSLASSKHQMTPIEVASQLIANLYWA